MKNPLKVPVQAFAFVRLTGLLLALVICLIVAGLTATAQAPAPDSSGGETKARALLAKLTLEQKISISKQFSGALR